jgi:uncharacterized membrane protein
MKGTLEFLKTTVVGGLLILLPAYLSLLLLVRAVAGVFALIAPITNHVPGGPIVARLLALLVVVAASFLAGLAVRTRLGRNASTLFERRVLERIPGYTVMRNLGRRLSGDDEGAYFAVALVEIEEALVPAFLVEELPDGAFTVFVPSVPTPAAGAVYILPKERVHRVDVPLATAVRTITQWGAGTGELLRAMKRA